MVARGNLAAVKRAGHNVRKSRKMVLVNYDGRMWSVCFRPSGRPFMVHPSEIRLENWCALRSAGSCIHEWCGLEIVPPPPPPPSPHHTSQRAPLIMHTHARTHEHAHAHTHTHIHTLAITRIRIQTHTMSKSICIVQFNFMLTPACSMCLAKTTQQRKGFVCVCGGGGGDEGRELWAEGCRRDWGKRKKRKKERSGDRRGAGGGGRGIRRPGRPTKKFKIKATAKMMHCLLHFEACLATCSRVWAQHWGMTLRPSAFVLTESRDGFPKSCKHSAEKKYTISEVQRLAHHWRWTL